MTPDKIPTCVCRCPGVTHQGERSVCVTPGCMCRGYWPGDGAEVRQHVPPLPPGHTRPVAR